MQKSAPSCWQPASVRSCMSYAATAKPSLGLSCPELHAHRQTPALNCSARRSGTPALCQGGSSVPWVVIRPPAPPPRPQCLGDRRHLAIGAGQLPRPSRRSSLATLPHAHFAGLDYRIDRTLIVGGVIPTGTQRSNSAPWATSHRTMVSAEVAEWR